LATKKITKTKISAVNKYSETFFGVLIYLIGKKFNHQKKGRQN